MITDINLQCIENVTLVFQPPYMSILYNYFIVCSKGHKELMLYCYLTCQLKAKLNLTIIYKMSVTRKGTASDFSNMNTQPLKLCIVSNIVRK